MRTNSPPLAVKRERIAARMERYLDEAALDMSFVEPWGRDVLSRLKTFVRGGKMVRGNLAILGYRIASLRAGNEVGEDEVPDGVIDLAAAMELIQAGLLIHDDIMDRDTSRRGRPSIFWQYVELAASAGLSDPVHQGESLGMCGGDVAFFLAFKVLAGSGIGAAALSYCCREIMLVGLAQMQDLWFGARNALPSQEDIVELYRLKTGRYSFSLPLALGAMFAGAIEEEVSDLVRLGESLGILFQIRDDELGLVGSPEKTGKPVGGDIREGKKTALWRVLVESTSDGDRRRLNALLGSQEIRDSDIDFVRGLLESGAAAQRLDGLRRQLRVQATDLIDSLDVSEEYRDTLIALLEFVSERPA